MADWISALAQLSSRRFMTRHYENPPPPALIAAHGTCGGGYPDDHATRTRSLGRPRCGGGSLLRRPHAAGGGEFSDQRYPDLDLSGPDRSIGLDQAGRGKEQPRARLARRQ